MFRSGGAVLVVTQSVISLRPQTEPVLSVFPYEWTFVGENGTTEVIFDVEYDQKTLLPDKDMKFFERRNEVEADAILTNLKARLEV
jgi:hypothetical protein